MKIKTLLIMTVLNTFFSFAFAREMQQAPSDKVADLKHFFAGLPADKLSFYGQCAIDDEGAEDNIISTLDFSPDGITIGCSRGDGTNYKKETFPITSQDYNGHSYYISMRGLWIRDGQAGPSDNHREVARFGSMTFEEVGLPALRAAFLASRP